MNLQKQRTNLLLGLILILGLALRLPGWFTQDEKTRFRLFEPDEYQHIQIAVYQIQCIDPGLLTDWDVERKMFNARGYGIQLGSLAWLNYRLWAMPLTIENLVLMGRVLSTIYALLLVVLVFYLGLLLFEKREIALMAALLMAICDLNVTYSHYTLPAVSYIFWTYLFVGSCCIWFKKVIAGQEVQNKAVFLYLSFMAWTAAATFAAKFDFIPFALGLLLIGITPLRSKLNWRRAMAFGLAFIALFVFSFALQTTFNFSLERINYSFWDLYRQNKDVIQEDNHWLFNPLVYLIGVIAGTSLPIAGFSGLGLYTILQKKTGHRPYLLIFLVLLALEAAVLWSSDVPFIRRANIFMPAIVLLAAWAWARLKPVQQKYWGFVMVLYTLGLCLVSQSNAWWDTRYAARQYLQDNAAESRIKYGSYSYAEGMPAGIPLKETEELLVLHEAAYSRYWKSFTTPFRIPKCCSEVYHCGEEDCQFMQDVVAGKSPDYILLKRFQTREYFPERVLFKKYLGNFETFLGDVLILRRINGSIDR